jgi:hypothetical protein
MPHLLNVPPFPTTLRTKAFKTWSTVSSPCLEELGILGDPLDLLRDIDGRALLPFHWSSVKDLLVLVDYY